MIGFQGTVKVLAAISGMLFMGYCVYFDKKRRSDPEFKKKLRERRNRQKYNSLGSSGSVNMSDKEIEMYFTSQIEKGEGLIANGDVEGGVDHLINAILVCSQPGKLLQVLQSTLPVEIFTMMLVKMHAYESAERSSPGIIEVESVGALE
ncbi:mitochondrial import receptor subunit TOM20 homolog [Drosophila ficusphila]|uniref:mitochondrial import receptor subunit TOM20 homolog n=1 Tax=Drosophila ficusphila TaxID=30025 RepID=UPI0007E5C63B|nr:mitochondrial import receptor subunit TOM20 homolog [Drosophila ficusphila]